MTRGIGYLIAAQFVSGLADNALLIVAIARLAELGDQPWMAPLLKGVFTRPMWCWRRWWARWPTAGRRRG